MPPRVLASGPKPCRGNYSDLAENHRVGLPFFTRDISPLLRYRAHSESLLPIIKMSPDKLRLNIFQAKLCASNLRDFFHEHALVIMRLILKVCDHLSLVCFGIKPRFVYQLNLFYNACCKQYKTKANIPRILYYLTEIT